MRILKPEGEGRNIFDSHFKDRLRNLEVEPSSELWSRIDDNLSAERERVRYDHWYYVALFLLGFVSISNLYVNYNLEQTFRVLHQNAVNAENNSELELASLGSDNSITIPWSDFYTDCTNPSSLITEATPPVKPPVRRKGSTIMNGSSGNNGASTLIFTENLQDEQGAKKSIVPTDFEASLVKTTGITGKPQIEAHHLMPDESYRMENYLKKSLQSLRGFHFGFYAGVNTGWLFFQEKALQPVAVDEVKRHFDWGSQYALSFGYDFSHQFGVQADWVFLSKQGHRFEENRFRKVLLNTEIEMTYMHVPVMFKYKWTTISHRTMNPKSLNFLLGAQYSRLRNVEVVMNEREIISERDVFAKNELGAIFGLEYDFYLHKNYYLTLGARSSISSNANALSRINSTDTYNIFIGVNAGISYFMPVTRRKG